MPPQSLQTEQDRQLVLRFKELTEELLPARAREQHWPIRFDHCFKRIALDAAFGDVWYRHLPRPAERHLSGDALRRAVACAEEMVHGDRATLEEHDGFSLRVRGKTPKQKRPAPLVAEGGL